MIVRKNNKIIERYEEHNLIVDKARQLMSHLVAGDVEGKSVTSIAFGTSGTPPTPADTEIANAYSKPVKAFSYPEINKVQIDWELLTTEDNGQAIREFGLLSADGTLFARRTRTNPINKEEDVSIEGSWTIIF